MTSLEWRIANVYRDARYVEDLEHLRTIVGSPALDELLAGLAALMLRGVLIAPHTLVASGMRGTMAYGFDYDAYDAAKVSDLVSRLAAILVTRNPPPTP